VRPAPSSFDTVLEATLMARDAAPGRPAPPPLRWLPDPGLQLLLRSGGRVGSRPRGLVSQNPGRATDNGAPVRIRSTRPSRPLAAADREALALLRGAGAPTLGEDFTLVELRHAWRRIALASHPDVLGPKAPGAARVNRTFAALAGAYARLRHVAQDAGRGLAEAGPYSGQS
jgi:hypothetical protein